MTTPDVESEPGTYWERAVLRRFVEGGEVDLDNVRSQVGALLRELPTPEPDLRPHRGISCEGEAVTTDPTPRGRRTAVSDLIAEGRAVLEANAIYGVVKLGRWARANLGALLDELETLRDVGRDRRDEIVCLRADLEAAQGSLLGYVAMSRPKDSDGAYGILIGRNLATDKLAAQMQRERFSKDEDMHVVLAEIREVES